MSKRFPDYLDPWRSADQGNKFSGAFKLDELSELKKCLSNADGEAEFHFEFLRDSKRRACLHGQVNATLHLICQRCLEKLILPIDTSVSIAFVEGLDEAEQLPDELDPELVSEGNISLKKIVEDELLLALPQAPMHSIDECSIDIGLFNSDEDEQVDEVSDSPFASLAELQRKE
jgi:uncharacterized protein